MEILSTAPALLEKTAKKAAIKGVKEFKKAAEREASHTYAITSGKIKSTGERRIVNYGYSAEITFAGKKIDLHKFYATPRAPLRGARVFAKQLKDGGKLFPWAFVQRMPDTGHIGIFENTEEWNEKSGRYNAISQIMAVSVPQMIGRRNVSEAGKEAAFRALRKELEKALRGQPSVSPAGPPSRIGR